MLYDNEETRKSEEEMAKNFENTKPIPPEVLAEMTRVIRETKALYEEKKLKPDKTLADLEELAQLKDQMNKMLKPIDDNQTILREKALRLAEDYYFNIKKHAEEGDEEARKIYEQLRPTYLTSLHERAGFDDLN